MLDVVALQVAFERVQVALLETDAELLNALDVLVEHDEVGSSGIQLGMLKINDSQITILVLQHVGLR